MQSPEGRGEPRIIHENVHLAIAPLERLGCGRQGMFCFGQVSDDGQATVTERRGGLAHGLAIEHVTRAQRAGQGQGEGLPQARCSAGDDSGPAVESEALSGFDAIPIPHIRLVCFPETAGTAEKCLRRQMIRPVLWRSLPAPLGAGAASHVRSDMSSTKR